MIAIPSDFAKKGPTRMLLEDMIAPALIAAPQYDIENVMDWILSGRMQMFVAGYTSPAGDIDFLAAMVTEILTSPNGNTLTILMLAGREMDKWLHLYPRLVSYAKSQGCRWIEVHGRKGWERVTSKFGFKLSHVVLRKEL